MHAAFRIAWCCDVARIGLALHRFRRSFACRAAACQRRSYCHGVILERGAGARAAAAASLVRVVHERACGSLAPRMLVPL